MESCGSQNGEREIRSRILFNGTPKCRSEGARECGSEKLKARKARKVVNRYAQRYSKVSE
ncbi:MAG: hypothetical protein WC721_17595 [Victivallaceae bacterium]